MSKYRKVLLLRKTSRLEYERTRFTQMSEEQFKERLIKNGSDYEGLLQRHKTHEDNVGKIHNSLLSHGVSVLLRDRDTIKSLDVDSTDALIAAGGDGNYLTAASHLLTPNKLLVGINTDAERSEGHLCITPTTDDSFSISTIVDYFMKGLLKYVKRQRMSISINGQTLPVLALNEAFIGETDPSQVSYFELSQDDSSWTKYRSSGLLVYTGTGSTSWAYNINKVSAETVQRLTLLGQQKGLVKEPCSKDIIAQITEQYNNDNIFNGSEGSLMSYVIREPIEKGLLHSNFHSERCSRIKVRSRSWNTLLIIDGQHLCNFQNGSEAIFTLGREHILSTAIRPF